MPLPASTPSAIACCLCGVKVPADRTVEGMCANCLNTEVDVTEGIERQLDVEMCRTCEQAGVNRWFRNPQWIALEPESAELLSLCLRKIRGLKGVQVVDASWIWTEPHSRRLKVKLTVRKEVLSGTTLQQSMVVEYIVKTRNCKRSPPLPCHRPRRPHRHSRQHPAATTRRTAKPDSDGRRAHR